MNSKIFLCCKKCYKIKSTNNKENKYLSEKTDVNANFYYRNLKNNTKLPLNLSGAFWSCEFESLEKDKVNIFKSGN